MLRVGATEAEREQVIFGLRAGKSYRDATAHLRSTVEAEWFERNEEHLVAVAKYGEMKAPLVDPPPSEAPTAKHAPKK
jgi:hypothetical protein